MSREIALFAGIVIIALMERLKHRFHVFALVALPSTFFHECMHFLVALASKGRPVAMSLIPHRTDDGYHLGHVQVSNITWYNAGLIGLAPLLLIPLAWWLLTQQMPRRPAFWPGLIWGYLLASMVYGSLPSGSDLRIAWRAPLATLGILALIPLALFVWRG